MDPVWAHWGIHESGDSLPRVLIGCDGIYTKLYLPIVLTTEWLSYLPAVVRIDDQLNRHVRAGDADEGARQKGQDVHGRLDPVPGPRLPPAM